MPRILIALLLSCLAGIAQAADPCPLLRTQLASPDAATRIAAVACNENMQWYRPFFASNGLLASSTVMEAETALLGDGYTPAWKRVAQYWQDAGLLPQMANFPGASECSYALRDGGGAPACRAFLVDNPWSAAFISWVMRKAYVPGFRSSASHIDYVRQAGREPADTAFDFLDPASARPAMGDMLCYARVAGRVFGHAGLRSMVDSGGGGLAMHCDIIVGVNPGNDGKAYLIGGNVQQAVTMRIVNVNRNGNFWGLPQRSEGDPVCSPDTEASCNFNRQDWAVLLKLKPASALQLLGNYNEPVGGMSPLPNPQACCINCVVGGGVPRCPKPEAP